MSPRLLCHKTINYLQTRQGHDAHGFYLKATSAYKMMTHWLAFLVRFRLDVQRSTSKLMTFLDSR